MDLFLAIVLVDSLRSLRYNLESLGMVYGGCIKLVHWNITRVQCRAMNPGFYGWRVFQPGGFPRKKLHDTEESSGETENHGKTIGKP